MVLDKQRKNKMKKILIIVIYILLLTCKSGNKDDKEIEISTKAKNSELTEISVNTWILEDKKIKSFLSDYINSKEHYSLLRNNLIIISFYVINDSTFRYVLKESLDIYTFLYDPPHMLFKFENRLVCLRISGLDIFKISDDFMVDFMKNNYPSQYKYYLEVGDYPPPVTGGCLVWKLTFQNGELISKEEYHTQ
jgi:hypothetical protein